MQNKFIRFFLVEQPTRARFFFVLALMLVSISEFYWYKVQRGKVESSLMDQQFAERIGKMKQAIQAQRSRKSAEALQVPEPGPNLQGIASLSETDYVLINGEVYKRGDKVGDYVVEDIRADAVVLRHQVTNQKTFLNISEVSLPKDPKSPLK